MTALEEIVGHLGAALMQSAPSDDQIIMDHIRSAHALAVAALKLEPRDGTDTKRITP